MKKVTKKTCENGLKSLIFAAVGCFILFLLSVFEVYPVEAQTWYLIALLAAVAVVQWGAVAFVLNIRSDEIGERYEMNTLTWFLTFLPAIVLVVLFVILYSALHGTVEFFALDGVNFLVSFAILAAGVALCYLFDYAYITATKKNQVQTTTVKIVKKESKSKKGKEPSKEDEKLAKKLDPEGAVFPDLVAIDKEFLLSPYVPAPSANVTLRQLCDGFNAYLESREMYYLPETIRAFVSGLACSHFMILEGLSGTGKTSLPKYFAEYTGANVCFTSVQASWKDRSDILGYYNDFVGKFKETPFLRQLYRASYEPQEVNLMVLDEMNLSRIEYYFADFLSVLELDESQWQIELMPISTGGNLPAKLNGCAVRIPQNVWFIGTANKDDSTFTVTDKVYDRAVIIDFSQRNESSGIRRNLQPIRVGADKLQALYEEAINDPNYNLSRADYDRFSVLTQFVLDAFDINFGNRILNQIVRFVPVYVACGGTSAKALDLMFARKVLRKLDGRFDDGIKANLVKLERLVLQQYNKTDFSSTLEVIARLKRKLF